MQAKDRYRQTGPSIYTIHTDPLSGHRRTVSKGVICTLVLTHCVCASGSLSGSSRVPPGGAPNQAPPSLSFFPSSISLRPPSKLDECLSPPPSSSLPEPDDVRIPLFSLSVFRHTHTHTHREREGVTDHTGGHYRCQDSLPSG